MSFWKKLAVGFKVALGITIRLQDAKLIRIKELDKVAAGVQIIEDAIKDAQKVNE